MHFNFENQNIQNILKKLVGDKKNPKNQNQQRYLIPLETEGNPECQDQIRAPRLQRWSPKVPIKGKIEKVTNSESAKVETLKIHKNERTPK